jgi:GT2 family glycosyltransferase
LPEPEQHPPPAVSVCVAVHRRRRPPNVATLASELAAALDGLRGELIVVLNGISPRRAHAPADATIVSFPVNRGVSVAWNAAAARATGRVLCFCNDDVALGARSLRLLHDALGERPEAGVVGPVGTRWDIAVPRHLEWVSLDGLAAGEARQCEVVSGFLFATPREVFERAGGFDEAYSPCGFEEVDLCTAVHLRLGLRCFAVAGVEHRHEFGVSAARPWHRVRYDGRSESLRSINRRNTRHFIAKWREALRSESVNA